MQNLWLPSRFLTSTMGDDQGLLDCWMIPLSSISATCLSTSALTACGTLLTGCVTGWWSVVTIGCFTTPVRPRALTPTSGVTNNPLFSSSSASSSFLCSLVNSDFDQSKELRSAQLMSEHYQKLSAVPGYCTLSLRLQLPESLLECPLEGVLYVLLISSALELPLVVHQPMLWQQ